MKTYVTVQDESRRLGISERHFRLLVGKGLIPSYKLGRRRLCVPQETDKALEKRFAHGAASKHGFASARASSFGARAEERLSHPKWGTVPPSVTRDGFPTGGRVRDDLGHSKRQGGHS